MKSVKIEMLPSMPLLMTPMKQLADDSSDTSNDSPPPHHSNDNRLTFDSSVAAQAEDPDQLLTFNDLDTGSSVVEKVTDKPNTPEKRGLSEPTSAQKKKKKTQHKKMLAALTPDSAASLDNSAFNFAKAYFHKVRSQLDEDKWSQFVQELVDFEGQGEKQPTELYKRMEVLLSPRQELVDEFLAFLLPHQALQVNRFIPYLLLCQMKEFFRKLNILLMKRQTQQVFSALECLAERPGVTLAEVKETVLPLLKSSSLLTNHFLALLPGERLPDSLMTDYEQVDLKNDSLFETIVVPDCPDPYGSENCVCSCHLSQNWHCISCGIKYLNGRVYLQHGKMLRPARVTFKGNKHTDLRKWEEDKCRSRRRLMPKTMLSPNCLDHRLNADSEDDCGVKKSPRAPRIRAAKSKACKKGITGNKEEELLDGIFPLVETKLNATEDNFMEVADEMKSELLEFGIGTEEQDFDEIVMENECNTEEDEEEDMSKCLHSENDSSVEGEDVVKELGNDCSFEDDEVDESNHSHSDENNKNDVVSSIHEICSSHSQADKTIILAIKASSENKDECMETNFKKNLFEVDQGPNSTSEIKHEDVPDVSREISGKIGSSTNETEPEKKLNYNFGKNEIKVESESIDKIEILSNSLLILKKPETESFHFVQEESVSCSGRSVGELESGKEWTRDEDKIILQTFQHENGLEQTFKTACLQLSNRTQEEIQERFEVLLKLLKEMISDESNSNP